MKAQLQPRQLLLVILAGWVNRQQQDAIGYFRTVVRQNVGRPVLPGRSCLLGPHRTND
jgi:hypothetical protein